MEQTDDHDGDLQEVLSRSPVAAPAVVLAHYPSTVFAAPPARVGLLLAGHTHGGQIRLPLLGCIWAHDRIPGRLARGLHKVGGTQMHVTAGLGVSGPIPLRILCPPELTVLTLRSPVAGTVRFEAREETPPYAEQQRKQAVAV
jgi:predicted MPP superfamily phosphohydrolase